MEQPTFACEHYERGRVLKQGHMFEQAFDAFRDAATDPQYAGKAYVQMALCLRSTHRGGEAVEAFRHALVVGTFSSQEKAHIFFLMGQTLESLGRYPEALEAYGWARHEDPGFRDVTQRIKQLIAGGRDPLSHSLLARQFGIGDLFKFGGHLRRCLPSLLPRSRESLSSDTDGLALLREDPRPISSGQAVGHQRPSRNFTPTRFSPPAPGHHKRDKRQHVRVVVRARSHFSSKALRVAGEGDLRDLSLGGCRVRSLVAVPVGTELECCIVPQDGGNPFTIEGTIVRWSGPQEFGLAFTRIRPGAQRQIGQLCGTRTVLGLEVGDRASRSV